jgi:Cdc6-like AAA superfamily ATPase
MRIFRKKTERTKHLAKSRDAGTRSIWNSPLLDQTVQGLKSIPKGGSFGPNTDLTMTNHSVLKSTGREGSPDRPDEPMATIGTSGHSQAASDENRPSYQPGSQSSPPLIRPEDELPTFKSFPPDHETYPFTDTSRTDDTSHAELWQAFTPSKPKYAGRFFAGRHPELQRVITAIEEDQDCIIVYGPRGIGKTSLANVISEAARRVGYLVIRYPCTAGTTFEEIFRGLLRSLPAESLGRANRARYSSVENFEQLLPPDEFGPTELAEALSLLRLDHAIMIIDEFDRVESEDLKNQLAEAIKNLSDAAARVTLIIVGIARNLEDLIGMHPSIQRHLVAIHVPLMASSELQRVILTGEQASGIRFDDDTRDKIVSFSNGSPYFAQLMALHAGRVALKRDSATVEMADLRTALGKVLGEEDPLIRESYDTATSDETNQFVVNVLYAAAAARMDRYGTFSAADAAKVTINDAGETIREIVLHRALSRLSQSEKNKIIEKWKTPAGKTQYTFVLHTMRQYVLLRKADHRGLA